MDKQQAVTLWDAVTFLAPLVGTGGVTAIVVAWLGARRPKAPEPPPREPALGIQAILADHMAMERFSAEVKRLADAAEDLGKSVNRACDMMDISRALDRLRPHDRD